MRIAVCGKFKSGKTSLLNLLLGIVLPVRAVTAAKLVTQIEKGTLSFQESDDAKRMQISPQERNRLILNEGSDTGADC